MAKRWSEYTPEEIIQNKKDVCAKCYYFSVHKTSNCTNWNDSTCDYLRVEKHSGGCLPTECVEKGIFREKKKRKRVTQIRIKDPWLK